HAAGARRWHFQRSSQTNRSCFLGTNGFFAIFYQEFIEEWIGAGNGGIAARTMEYHFVSISTELKLTAIKRLQFRCPCPSVYKAYPLRAQTAICQLSTFNH